MKQIVIFFKGLWIIGCFYVPIYLLSTYLMVPLLYEEIMIADNKGLHAIEQYFIYPLLTAVLVIVVVGIASLIYTAGDAFETSKKNKEK